MSNRLTNRRNFDEVVEELAYMATNRYFTATMQENMAPEEAMREIIRAILEEYRDAFAN